MPQLTDSVASNLYLGSKLGFNFTALFGSVPAFGYYSTESEPIWITSKALLLYCRGTLPRANSMYGLYQ